MAEILGIVSGAAGLTSLVLQLADSTSRLRKAYKLTKKMPGEVEAVARDLDFICMVAERLHYTDSQADQPRDQASDHADRIVAHYKASIQALVKAMEALSQKASSVASRKGLRTSAQRLKWMSSCEDDLESLRRLAHNAQWRLMLCDRREYIYSFRMTLCQLGFPWAFTATLGIQSGYSIGLVLRPQHIVRYTSPGFELLYKIHMEYITLDEGISEFTELYRKDPSFIHQVDPAGQGYIQSLLDQVVFLGDRTQLNVKVSLLRLFAEFGMTQGLDDIKLIALDPEFGHTSLIQREIIESPEQALGMDRHLCIGRSYRRTQNCCKHYAEFMGGDPSYPLTSTDSIVCALRFEQRDYLFGILRHIQTSAPDYVKTELCSSLAKHILAYMATGVADISLSCDDVITLATLIDDINFELNNPPWSHYIDMPLLLLHSAWAPVDAETFIRHGYTAINRKGGEGKTALMAAAFEGHQALVQFYMGLGVLVNDQDNAGSTALMSALQMWYRGGDIGRDRKPFGQLVADYPGTVKLLVEAGAEISKTDGCQCSCSNRGCTAIHIFCCQFDEYHGPFVAVEWLNLPEELGMEDDLKLSLITLIRRSRFEELQLNHTCCENDERRKMEMLSAPTQSTQRHTQLEAEMESIEGLELQ
ncbi:hypothetical protein PG999_001269 [Apiospora kogelbergensis]|uniref:Ankyrin repeat-containing protein n=1 Tax=Apiospora kogelbergensis TaxID=1337665 RepID=A0AAW0REA3_9PEZI